MKYVIGLIIATFLFLSLLPLSAVVLAKPQIWEIRSIDTMKMSRDKARAKLDDLAFDKVIDWEMQSIKMMGANYVAIDTPYDAEFRPFLNRWVTSARKHGLAVWFRGNWSNWEGWFDYPKNLTPDEHIAKTHDFITKNADLFVNNDIFEACPECENSGYWQQPADNNKYQLFIRNERFSLEDAFSTIQKNIHTNYISIIGGRAKDVLDQRTFTKLENVATIDHYAKNPANYEQYIAYFNNRFQTKVLFSEIGAPIPDIHGNMNEDEQADFIDQVLSLLYKHRQQVVGLNYWVLSDGTTALYNDDGSERKALGVLKKYFLPGAIAGEVKNPLGDRLANVQIKTGDSLNSTTTDKNGRYYLILPQGDSLIEVGGKEFTAISKSFKIEKDAHFIYNEVIEPKHQGLLYRLRLFLRKVFYVNKKTK